MTPIAPHITAFLQRRLPQDLPVLSRRFNLRNSNVGPKMDGELKLDLS